MMLFNTLSGGIAHSINQLRIMGEAVTTNNWQSIPVGNKQMVEYLNCVWGAPIPQSRDALVDQVKPSLPWADLHFKERVSGCPLNPGESYKDWPWYKNTSFNDENFRGEGKFSHTYMERYWPKLAGDESTLQPHGKHLGIWFEYGDLGDVIQLLANDPKTRQAYLPVWFPEDTGVLHGKRVPCTLGYQFILRGGQLHVTYFIRSCDAMRHFRNDIYLTCRLVDFISEQLVKYHGMQVCQGTFTMHIVSLHCFKSEINLL